MTKKNIENSAAYISTTTRFAARSCASRKIDSGTSGASATRARRTRTRRAAATAGGERHEHAGRAPAERVGAHDPVGQADQPGGHQQRAGDVEVARTARRARRRGSRAAPRTITSAPSGTLMAKIAGQPSAWVSTPPSSAPEEAPRPPIAPHAPRPRLRSGPSGSEEVMIDSVAGETTAPPKPCSARAAMQQAAGVGERAQQRGEHEQAPCRR